MQTTTPSAISKNILDLCSELVQTPEPIYLKVEAIQGAPLTECFTIVDEHIQNHGGSCCYGWQIWEWPLVMIEAEFHAVWRNGNGVLHDLTPKQIKVDRILFLPDPVNRYAGKQVNNVRRALTTQLDVGQFIKAADSEFEIINRGDRADRHGEIAFEGQEAEEYNTITQSKLTAYQAIVKRLSQLRRNDPCPCGSGKKYKKCHG